jgi:hypothetical protein
MRINQCLTVKLRSEYLQIRVGHHLKVRLECSVVWTKEFERLRNRCHRACCCTNLLPDKPVNENWES